MYSHEIFNSEILMPLELKTSIPSLYGQSEIALADKLVYATYYIPNSNWIWYLTEYEPKTFTAFGLVLGNKLSWDYFFLRDLKASGAKRKVFFKYPKTFREIKSELFFRILDEVTLEQVFCGQLSFDEITEQIKNQNFSSRER